MREKNSPFLMSGVKFCERNGVPYKQCEPDIVNAGKTWRLWWRWRKAGEVTDDIAEGDINPVNVLEGVFTGTCW